MARGRWCIIRILEQLRDLRTQLYSDNDKKEWENTWNSTLRLAMELGVYHLIPKRILKLQK